MRKITLTLLFIVVMLGVTTKCFALRGELYGADRLLSSRTICVVQDKYGFIWLGTESGLNRFDGYRFTSYKHSVKNGRSIAGIDVAALYVSKNGELWVGTGSGLCRYNYGTDDFERIELPVNEKIHITYISEAADGAILAGSAGYGLFSIKNGKASRVMQNILVDGANFCNEFIYDRHNTFFSTSFLPVIYTYGKEHGKMRKRVFNTGMGAVSSLSRDDNGRILAFCPDGVLRYDAAKHEFHDAGFNLSALQGAKIRRAYKTRGGDYILGTRANGVFVIRRGENNALALMANGKPVMPKSNVNWICEDRQGGLWLSCYQSGLYHLSAHNDVFDFWTIESGNELQGKILSAMALYGNGLMGAISQDGIYTQNAQGSITSYFPAKNEVSSIVCDAQGRYWACGGHNIWQYMPLSGVFRQVMSNSNFEIEHMAVDNRRGLLYYCAVGHAFGMLNTKTMESTEITGASASVKDRLNNCWIQSIMVDRLGLVWISTADGVSCYNPEKKTFLQYGWTNLLTHQLVYGCCEDRWGNIIIGTNNGLFYFDRKANTVERMKGADALCDLQIYSIILDREGDVWMSSSEGIWHYNSETCVFTSYLQGNGLEAKQYVQDAALMLPDGRLVFGSDRGAVVFNPSDLRRKNNEKLVVSLSRFLVDDVAMDFRQREFRIPAGSTSFTMELSMLDYEHPEYVTYQYRLEKDSVWHETQEGVNSLTFSKMKAGSYEVEIRALVNGQYSEITSLEVVIEAPWYASTWAKIIYLILFVLLMTALVRYKQQRMRTQYEEQKMKFLINATHDIRSPLTLIMGPLKKLKENVDSAESQRYIGIIERNAQRMLTLVNQILDVRKIDLKQMQIHCSKTDIVSLVNGIVSLYRFHVKERNISLSVTSNKDVINVYVDRGNMEKVINNLLSNAVKYTFDGGAISIDIEERENDVVLSVEDNGVGMNQKEYVQVFDRYYQGTNSRGFNVGGTGIGLNLCKQLVEMHHGSIVAGPRCDGKQGSRFVVSLQLGKEHLLPEEIDESVESSRAVQKSHSRKDCKILVADDDMEVARYIKMELGMWYSVNIVSNGADALQALLADQYDLLISDVMMPEMDGITLLKNVKQNPNISDVPVILLTSKAEVEDRLRGLENGADAFIAKPFTVSELHITIDNLISNVRRLRGKFSGMQTQDDKIDNVEMEDNDKRLMEKIVSAVNNNYTDSDYGVEQLASDVGLSRVQLHRKMKQLTGIAASDFIRNIRLKQAARLISENNVNISQVAYAVGFKSLAHFSTLFKKYYGVSPSESAKRSALRE